MNTFKDDVSDDILSVFLECDEFAEIHKVDGLEILAVIDEINADERTLKAKDHVIGDAIFEKYLKVYVKAEDYGDKPTVSRRIFRLDDEIYRVVEVDEEMGMYVIYLGVSDE